MLTLHHLNFSRSIRVLWLLEHLHIPYTLVKYERNASFRAPPALAKIHPLGKAPIIVDDALVLAESATILRYVHDRYGDGTLTPTVGTAAHALHEEWLDYVEGSAAFPILTLLIANLKHEDAAVIAGARAAVDQTLSYIAERIDGGPWIMGERLMLADMHMSYLLAMARATGALAAHAPAAAYLARIEAHPAFMRATSIGGPMLPPNF